MNSTDPPSIALIIVAAGRGQRAGTENGPKQYRRLAGLSVLQRTIRAFCDHEGIQTVTIVVHEDDYTLYERSVTPHSKLITPVEGGDTRQKSVLAGLLSLKSTNPDYVLIHDAARPFVDQNLIHRILSALKSDLGVIPVLPVADTLKRGSMAGGVLDTIDRNGLFMAQTPQAFPYKPILKAHEAAKSSSDTTYTDDASIAEAVGMAVHMIEGNPNNTKLTTVTDMENAEKKLASIVPDVRTGHGYDVHQLVEGTSITLCGIDIIHNRALSGHSDADVALHALTDALLATIGDGDIGSHFPPTDAEWKGAASDQFLKHAVDLIAKSSGVITHMDVTLVCEAPKIGPHRDAMKRSLSTITGVASQRISVKATTNERIGFIGREEGIAAFATATVAITSQE